MSMSERTNIFAKYEDAKKEIDLLKAKINDTETYAQALASFEKKWNMCEEFPYCQFNGCNKCKGIKS